MGLAQVHGFIKQSGGDIEVRSELGQGTTIILLLPRTAKGAMPASSEEKANAAALLKTVHPAGRTVLVVDDNLDVAAFVATMLGELGYTTRQAGSAAEALEALTSGDRIDVVFSDIVMPGEMSGVELARVNQRDYSGIAVVLATGYSDQLGKLGVRPDFEILAKPYRMDDLAAALARALRQKDGSQEATQ